MKFKWSDLPAVTNSQCARIEQLLSSYMYVRYVDILADKSIVMHCNHKQITISTRGKLTQGIMTRRSVAWYLHSLQLANRKFYTFHPSIPGEELAQMLEAYSDLIAWSEEYDIILADLGPV